MTKIIATIVADLNSGQADLKIKDEFYLLGGLLQADLMRDALWDINQAYDAAMLTWRSERDTKRIKRNYQNGKKGI